MSSHSGGRSRIVTALLRARGRVLLCHRCAGRRWYPNLWDLPGGHVEPGERAAAALVRELREELGIAIAAPTHPPLHRVQGESFDMRIWLVESWIGTPVNAAPQEHDAIGWFDRAALADLRLAHHSFRTMLTEALGADPGRGGG